MGYDALGNCIRPGEDTTTIVSGSMTSRDAGPSWTPQRKALYAADGSTAFDATDAPGLGNTIVLDDLLVAVDTDCILTLQMETSGNVLMGWPVYANSSIQVTARDFIKGDAPTEKLQLKTSVASKVYGYSNWHVE